MFPSESKSVDSKQHSALDLLLRVLATDVSADAERTYQSYRQQLVRFFTWERTADPDLCADETFTRAARRLAEGEPIDNPRAYLFGIARIVSKESHSRQQREATALQKFRLVAPSPSTDPVRPEALACLQQCLSRLDEQQRTLILSYYTGDHADRIAARKQLAEQLGIELNTLRNRALRLRSRLEACVTHCLRSSTR